MRVAPVSADLLIKLALLAGGVIVVAYVVRKASTAAGDAAGAVWSTASQAVRDGAWAVTPWNNENVVYQGVNNTLFPDGSDTLGTWLYGITHPEPRPENIGTNSAFYVPTGWDVTPQGPNGPRYNNPSAYIAPVGAHSIYR
ncbi:hypothetical protein LJR129_002493 [Acidovorax sp. LjRoot129]|uniref:hypothetical protein n=1 Tax=Acidovorax sp. LjRoot129 TaxID=3342260 RepID=UPI003ED129A6